MSLFVDIIISAFSAAFGFENTFLNNITIVVEIVFFIDMILCKTLKSLTITRATYSEFFMEYISEEDYFPVRNLKKIGMRYLQ